MSKPEPGRIPRTVVLLLAILIVAGGAAVFIAFQLMAPEETISTTQVENITILDNGDATLQLVLEAGASALANTYVKAIEEVGEDNLKHTISQGLQMEHKIMNGLDVSVTGTDVEVGPDNSFQFSVSAAASRVARYNSAENLWIADLSPPDENDKEAAGLMLTQMMLAQQMVKSQPGRQRLEFTSSLPIVLPEKAVLYNVENLSRLKWRVDFGGGSYREAWLTLSEDHRVVTLHEKVVVTENPPDAPTGELFTKLHEYQNFQIKYRLPGSTPISAPPPEESVPPKKGHSNTDFSWSSPSWTVSTSVSHTFSSTLESDSGSVTAEAGVSAGVSTSFDWYIGWDFAWVQTGEWWEWSYELQWFRTYLEIQPEVSLNLSAGITGALEKEWEADLWDWSKWIWVQVGYVPVAIEVRLDVGAGVEANAEGSISLTAGATASATYKLGVEWTKSGGWGPIAEQEYSWSYSGPTITASAEASVTPYLKFRLGAYFYGTAGPYVELKPLVLARLEWSSESASTLDWKLEGGFDINAGVGFGAISEWVDLPDWSTTLYSWRTTLASGSLELQPEGGGEEENLAAENVAEGENLEAGENLPPENLIPVSSALSVIVYEKTGAVYEHEFSVAYLSAGEKFSTAAGEIYTVSSDGTYLKIACYRDAWMSGTNVGNNIVAVKLSGVSDYPDGVWATFIENYTLGYNGIAESRFNALGPENQLGPYENSLCTYMGDQMSELVLGFTPPAS